MPPVRVFISYSHDSDAHRARVLDLAQKLRSGGVDASIDRFADPPEGWRLWCEKEIAKADLVLVICTEPYKRRAEGNEEIGKGKGATYEAAVIGQAIYDGSMVNAKFLPVTFAGDEAHIPGLLKPVKRYSLWDGYDQLYRRITDQPEVVPAALGEVKPMPPLATLSEGTHAAPTEPAAAPTAPAPAPAAPAPAAPAPAPPPPEQAWNVPFPRNPNFIGRNELLAGIRKGFVDGGTIAVLTGLPGVGKTQAALEYVYRHRADYRCIGWLRSEDPSVLTGDFTALGIEAGAVPASTGDQRAAVAVIREWLERTGDWLLVFDFAPGTTVVREYVPTGGRGHVLVTSRDRRWRELAPPTTVAELSREEAVALLQARSGTEDPEGANKVAEALGHLPLALVQAAAYVEETGGTFQDYLALYEKRRDNVHDTSAPTDHPTNVNATFRVAIESLNARSPGALGLLQACAFLDPEGIPLSLFSAQAERIGGDLGAALADPVKLQAALSAAIQLALIERNGDTITCHRVVQTVTRDDLQEAARKDVCLAVLNLVAGAFPFEWKDPATWPQSQVTAPHVVAATGHAEALGVELDLTGALLQRLGSYQHRRGLLAEARATLERALAILIKAHGTEAHPAVADTRNELGQVLQILGDLSGARAQLEQALAVYEKLAHADVPVALLSLAAVLHTQGDLPAARALQERALAMQLETHGKADHEQIATSLHELGRLLLNMGDFPAARDHLERSLDMQRRLWGEEHPESASTLQMLGSTLHAQGDLAGAREKLERALAIKRKSFGEEHLEVASALHFLGGLLIVQGEKAAGREKLEQGLAMKRKVLGTDDHVEVAASLHSLGGFLVNEGDLTGARSHLEQALAILRKVLGGDTSTEVASVLVGLSRVLLGQGDAAAARARLEEALALQRKLLGGDESLDVAVSLHELGGIVCAQGDLPAAKAHLEQALVIERKILGTDDHPLVAASLHQLGAILYAQKEFAAARIQFEACLASKRKLHGTDENPDVTISLQALAAVVFAEGDHAGARAQLERVIAINTKLEGTRDRWSIALTEESLANVLRKSGDVAAARTLLEHAHAICQAQLGADHAHTKRVAGTLASLAS